jgi:hypothetical protein
MRHDTGQMPSFKPLRVSSIRLLGSLSERRLAPRGGSRSGPPHTSYATATSWCRAMRWISKNRNARGVACHEGQTSTSRPREGAPSITAHSRSDGEPISTSGASAFIHSHRPGAGEDEGFYEANSAVERVVRTRRLSCRCHPWPGQIWLPASFACSAMLNAKLQSGRRNDTVSSLEHGLRAWPGPLTIPSPA